MSAFSPHSVIVLIAAAGSGSRCGGEIPKQYQSVNGTPLLRYTVEKFTKIEAVSEIRVIISPDDAKAYHEAVHGLNLPDPVHGGATRKESVYNGLSEYSNTEHDFKILIHDAARPLLSADDIEAAISALDENRAVTLAKPVSDTLRRNDYSYVDRNGLWAIQTPQGFHFQTLWQAHEALKDKGDFTDDASMVAEMGSEISLIPATAPNFKITTQDDMMMAKALMSGETEIRTGQGFDVHAFDLDAPGPVRLCGIDIAHDHKLKGHSDADVGLHTITDAILGAIGAGDIGMHFPPSDNQWKGKDSAYFLTEAMTLMKDKGGELVNIDLTIICEAPKTGPHREAILNRLSAIMEIDSNRINVKGTTTEQLGFTGRKEGIAAQAVANVRMPKAQ